jgi:hypothetical protein
VIDPGQLGPRLFVYRINHELKNRRRAMTKQVPDKAEVAVEYPDKLYIGTFERTAGFGAHLDKAGISLACTAWAQKTCANPFECTSTMGVSGNPAGSGEDCTALPAADTPRSAAGCRESPLWRALTSGFKRYR